MLFLHDGSIYGYSESLLVCLDAKTGDLSCGERSTDMGASCSPGTNSFFLAIFGELTVVNATQHSFQEIYSRTILGNTRCWNGPALVNGYLFARNGEQIACFDWAK